jgi:DTW domain-containing protein YfiP
MNFIFPKGVNAMLELKKCYRCFRSKAACFCEEIKSFKTETKFIILMHPKEARREKTGTGRITQLSLINSELIVGIDFSHEKKVNDYLENKSRYICYLLYPGTNALVISSNESNIETNLLKNELKVTKRELVLFIIDGTWPCARKMMKESKNLHFLPRICFAPKSPSQFIIKQQPHQSCLSTIEAVAEFLLKWEYPFNFTDEFKENISGLHGYLKRINQFQISCAENPELSHHHKVSRPYQLPQMRKPSKKWETRNLFFNIIN